MLLLGRACLVARLPCSPVGRSDRRRLFEHGLASHGQQDVPEAHVHLVRRDLVQEISGIRPDAFARAAVMPHRIELGSGEAFLALGKSGNRGSVPILGTSNLGSRMFLCAARRKERLPAPLYSRGHALWLFGGGSLGGRCRAVSGDCR